MKKRIFIIIVTLNFAVNLMSQTIKYDIEDSQTLSEFPLENVLVHYNSSLLFVGEYLYYSFYCINPHTNQPSIISKIGYIDLVDFDGNVIVRQKLRLENGKASADMFIPVATPSGNYKIIGYTKWMLNQETFLNQDISIINPYQENQKSILGEYVQEKRLKDVNVDQIGENDFDIILDKDSYKKRSKVKINIKNVAKTQGGNFSLSVHKVSPLKRSANFINLNNSLKNSLFEKKVSKENFILLPEVRGEMISGKITSKNDSLRVSNIKISLSIPDNKESLIMISNTDKNGFFYFNINQEYKYNADAVFQVVDKNKNFYKIKLDDHPLLDYTGLEFDNFSIAQTPEIEELLTERSIHNQVENSYFIVKPDSIIEKKPLFLFEDKNILTYNLDDYTRFKTVRETLIEIVDHVWTEKRNGENRIRIRELNTDYDNSLYIGNDDPLVLVDGILMQNHNFILDFDARKVESISVIRDKYVYGNGIYQGVVIIQTQSEEFMSLNQENYVIRKKLQAPETGKKYFKQNYSKDNNEFTSHIPDFRYQLLWEPNVILGNNIEGKHLVFYTSDVLGTFNISLVGFTVDGKPISVNKSFTVEE